MGEQLELGQGACAYLYTKDRDTSTDREKMVGRTKTRTRAPRPLPSSNEQEQSTFLAREGPPRHCDEVSQTLELLNWDLTLSLTHTCRHALR